MKFRKGLIYLKSRVGYQALEATQIEVHGPWVECVVKTPEELSGHRLYPMSNILCISQLEEWA